jgi:hypothetical protein
VPEEESRISSDTIKVGENAVITLTGGQLDVADFLASERVSMVEITRMDKMKFKVKGLTPGNAVLKFRNGKNEATVQVRIVPMGYGEPKSDFDYQRKIQKPKLNPPDPRSSGR